MLIEHHDLQAFGVSDSASVRPFVSRKKPHQSRLAAAVTAEKTEPHPRREREVEALDDRSSAVGLGQILGDDQLLRTTLRRREVDRDRRSLRAAIEIGEFALKPPGLVDARLR